VTEILLRQTRADAVAEMWQDFMSKYPDARALRKVKPQILRADIAHLGLSNQRARDLRNLAARLITTYRGKVPKDLESLLQLPGVGPYSAHAVHCFAFSQPSPIVDTNILRFFSRYFGITYKYPDIRRNKWAWDLAREALPRKKGEVKAHNYGLLDFTGTICLPRNPLCSTCPLLKVCKYGQAIFSQ
jgi:A/G-specific adenine glycosylase